jgi:two-component system, cell cycle sensor histidine kinase and response regulator CckA
VSARPSRSPLTEPDDASDQIRFQARLLAAVGQAVVATDAAGAVTYWNDEAERMFGWSRDEVLGRPLEGFVIPDGDGPAGTLVGIIGVSSDISEAKAAEAALQTSEERLRGVLASAPLAIIEFDADARVLFWNPAAEVLYGWRLEEIRGRRLEFRYPDEEAAFYALFDRVVSGEHLRNVEVVGRRRNGILASVSLSMSPLWNGLGQVVGVSSAGLDISLQRQMEKALSESHKMDGIGRLARGIAHDFNNLLSVVLGHAELLLQDLPDGPATERVQAMHRAARRAADLTDQLLTFSRQQVTVGGPVDLNALVASMEPMLARILGEDIELRLDLCAGAPIVAPDRSQMQHVILSLVENARDAMPDGGVLGIATTNAAGARLIVSDTGTGMGDLIRARIFEPFFSTKAETKETGLGLSTVFGIVTQHGGDIDVSSRPGAGSVFTVSLPPAISQRELPPPEG